MRIDDIIPVFQAVSYSLTQTEARRLENSVRAGENASLSATLQIAQANKAINFTNKALEAAGNSPVSLTLKAVVYLTPVVIGILKKMDLAPEKLRPIIEFVHSNLGAFYQTSSIVSALALLYFGQTAFGITSLAFLLIGCMDQNGLLPTRMRQILHQLSPPLLVATGVVAGGILDRIFVLLSLLSWGANIYLSKVNKMENLPRQSLSYLQMQRYLRGDLTFEVNKEFIHYSPFPPVPDIDIQTLVQRFDQIDWTVNIRALREKLKRDPRFIERHRDPALKTDQEIINIARDSLTSFVTSIKERRVLNGEPADYTKLLNYIKIIAKYVENLNDETTRVDVLFRLAVEGGEYCGPGKFEVAESIFAQTLGENNEIPLRDKVVHCLQDERNAWMEKFYYETYVKNPLSSVFKIFDMQDVHNHNLVLNLFSHQFGLRCSAAANDDAALIGPMKKLLFYQFSKLTFQKSFWKKHKLYDAAETLIEAAGTPKLPKPEIYAYWQSWIERLPVVTEREKEIVTEGRARPNNQENPYLFGLPLITQREKDDLLEKFATPDEEGNTYLFGIPFEVNRKINPKFIIPMLYEMGIAKIN